MSTLSRRRLEASELVLLARDRWMTERVTWDIFKISGIEMEKEWHRELRQWDEDFPVYYSLATLNSSAHPSRVLPGSREHIYIPSFEVFTGLGLTTITLQCSHPTSQFLTPVPFLKHNPIPPAWHKLHGTDAHGGNYSPAYYTVPSE